MTDIVLRIQTALGGAVADVGRFRKTITDTAIATTDLRDTWRATTADIIAETQKQVAAEKEKLDQYRAQQVAIRELTSTYKKGSDERRIAAQLEIDMQRKVQAALGETAAVAGRAGRASAQSAERDASGFARGAGSRSGVVGAGMSALAGPGFLAGALIGGAVDMGVKAAKAEEAAQANLANALKDTGQARRVSRKALEEYVQEEEKSTGFQRDEVSQTLSQLIRSTGSLSKARQEEAVMANVARGRNTDLSGAMMLVMRAAEGNVGSLKRLGLEIPKVTTYEDQLKAAHLTGNLALEKRAKALDLAATKTTVMRAVTQKFAGDSTSYMHTFGGETARLSNTWRDLEVQIGEKSIPLLTKLFSWLEKEVTALEHNKRAIDDGKQALHIFERGIEGVDKVTGSFVNTLKLLAAWYVTGKVLNYANTIRKSLTSAYEAASKAVTAFRRTTEVENAAVAASSEEAGAVVDAAFPWIAIAQLAVIATVEIVTHWKTVKRWFGDFWGYLKTGWRDAVDFIKGVFYGWVASEILILKALADAAAGALGWVPGIGGKLKDAAHQIDSWYTEFKNKSVSAFGDIGKASGDAFARSYVAAARDAMNKPGTYVPSHRAGPRGQVEGAHVTTGGSGGGGSLQQGLVQTGETALGNPYQFGGTPSLSSPTDCSGLMVAIFARYGIRLPRRSEEQYSEAPIKNRKPLAPGDLVFSEGVHPGHVGLYIGGGNVLEDPHTGDHVKVIPLKNFGWNGESARWWAQKAKSTPKGGGGGGSQSQMPAGWDQQVSSAQAAASSKGGVTKPTIIGVEAQIAAELRDMPKHLDAVEREAIKHIKQLRDDLHVGMSQAELAKDKAALARWGKVLRDEIKKNADEAKKAALKHAREVKAAARAAAQAWADGWTADVNIIERQISEQWNKIQRKFDEQTQLGLQKFIVAQTPQEKALADYQAKLQAEQSAQTKAQLQSDLAAAIATGDPAQIKAAQDAINQQLEQDRLAALQQAAADSRAAADAQTSQQQAAYQQQRDDQWQALQDQHDDQVAMFDADLKLWQTALQNKSKTWAQFLRWLKNNPISEAVAGGTIDNPINYSTPTIDSQPTGGGGGSGGGGGGVSSPPPHLKAYAAGGVHLRPTIGMFGDQGPEATVPLTGQAGQAAITQLAKAIALAGGLGGGGGTVVYGTFLGATEKQVGRALEGLVTPAQRRVVRYKAPL